MRRTIESTTKARLSFSGGPHVPVNMAKSMENAGNWTVSGAKEAMGVPKNFKDLRKLGVRNIAQYSAPNMRFHAFYPPAFTSSILSAMFAGPCGLPEKLSLDLVRSVHDCAIRLIFILRWFSKHLARKREKKIIAI